jgi:hypothetical protein
MHIQLRNHKQIKLLFAVTWIFAGDFKVKHSRYTPWRRLGERRYSSYSFMTSALDGVSGQRHAPAAI